jgi:hypothetical protein
MAIAGCFGLDIYVISLLDVDIRDSELIGLFNMLPPKCLRFWKTSTPLEYNESPQVDAEMGRSATMKTKTKTKKRNRSFYG